MRGLEVTYTISECDGAVGGDVSRLNDNEICVNKYRVMVYMGIMKGNK